MARRHRRKPVRVVRKWLPGLVVLACVGVFAAGCTFERRPNAQSGGQQEVALDEPGESPRGFLQRLQRARREGSPQELRALLHPDARLLQNGSVLQPEGGTDSGTAVASLLLGLDGGEVDPVEVESTELGDAALYLLRYPDGVETLLVARDSVGWRLRFLHQVSGSPDG